MPITKLGGMTAGLQGGMALINNFEDIKTANLHREALSQQNAMGQLKLDEERKQQELLDRPIPISVLEAQISQQSPEWWKHTKETATGAKLIMTNSAGIEYTTPRNINTFMGMLNQQNDLGMASLKSMSADLNNRILQAQQAMQTAKKPEEQQAAAQQYKQLTEQLSSVVGAMNSMDDKVRQATAEAEIKSKNPTPRHDILSYINPTTKAVTRVDVGMGETPPEGSVEMSIWKQEETDKRQEKTLAVSERRMDEVNRRFEATQARLERNNDAYRSLRERVPAAEVSQLSGLKVTYDRLNDVSKRLSDPKMLKKVGPVAGRFNKLKVKFMNDGLTQEVINDLNQTITLAYGLSGKQISYQEMQMLKEAILPQLEQPGSNIAATLRSATSWIAKTHDEKLMYLNDSGYTTKVKPLSGGAASKLGGMSNEDLLKELNK